MITKKHTTGGKYSDDGILEDGEYFWAWMTGDTERVRFDSEDEALQWMWERRRK